MFSGLFEMTIALSSLETSVKVLGFLVYLTPAISS